MADEKFPGFGFTRQQVQDLSEFMASIDSRRIAGAFLPPELNEAVYTKMAELLGVPADKPDVFIAAALPDGEYAYNTFEKLGESNWAAIILEQAFKDASTHAHTKARIFLGYIEGANPNQLGEEDKAIYMLGLSTARDWINAATGMITVVEPLHVLTTPEEPDRYHVDNYSQPIWLTENEISGLERKMTRGPMFDWLVRKLRPPEG